MVAQWVINSHTVNTHLQIMKDFLKFNIDRTNSDGPMIIYQILSIVNLIDQNRTSNVKTNLVKINMIFLTTT